MKNRLLALLIVLGCAITASAQVDTVKTIQKINGQGYAYKNIQADSSLSLPQDTFRLKSTWRGVAFKGSVPYYWSGTKWEAFGTGSGSADSAIFATLYRLDTAKANLRTSIAAKLPTSDTANKWITSLYRRADSVFYIKGGTHTFAYKDSTGSGGGSSGTVTSIATNTGTGITGGTITTSGTIAADTTLLSTRLWRQKGIDSVQANVNLKVNISDTATMLSPYLRKIDTTGIRPQLFAGTNVTITGTYPTLTIAASGGGGSADSSIFATQYRLDTVKANRLRLSDTAALLANYLRGSGTSGQFALFNGTRSIYSSSKFVYSDASYPSASIVGNDPLFYFGGTGAAYPSFGKAGTSAVVYGSSSGRSISFFDQQVGGRQMLRLYATAAGANAIFGKTAVFIDTAVGGPSTGSVHVEYSAGDSTSIGTDVGRHMFRGIGRTYANAGSFNTFYSTVVAGNTTYNQDHIISWQSDATKFGANTLDKIYHLGILGDSIKAGTVNNRYGVYMYDAKVTAGATLTNQYGVYFPAYTSAVNNYGVVSLTKNGFGTATPDSMLTTTSLHSTAGVRLENLPTGGAAADSVLVVTSTGTVKKRNASSFGGVGSSITVDSLTYNNGTSTITLNLTGQSDVSVTLPNSYIDNAVHPDSISKQVNDSTIKLKAVSVTTSSPYFQVNTTRTDTTLRHDLAPVYVSEPLFAINVGGGIASDTTLFTDSTLYGSFYTGQDSIYITQMYAVLKGQAGDTLGISVTYNDSINVTGTVVGGGTQPVNSRTTGNSIAVSSNQGIPPNTWVWIKSPTVIAGKKPEYLSITLIGYKVYIAP